MVAFHHLSQINKIPHNLQIHPITQTNIITQIFKILLLSQINKIIHTLNITHGILHLTHINIKTFHLNHGVQMNNILVQLNDQELEKTPQFCTQDGLETINLGEDVGTTSNVNTSKTRFQPEEDELLIQSWLNISMDPIVGIDKKKIVSGRGLVNLITTKTTRIFQRENRWH
jgi:hypothetical protein